MRSHFGTRWLLLVALACSSTLAAADGAPLCAESTFDGRSDAARTYWRTERTDYPRRHFLAEVSVMLKGGGGLGCAFFGIGRGKAVASAYYEPTAQPALFLRLAPSDFAGGAVRVNVNGKESGQGAFPVGDGVHRVQLFWDAAARRALFRVDGKPVATVSAAQTDFGAAGHLFLGGAGGVRFTNLVVKVLTDAEIAASGFGETFVNDASAGTWLSQAGERRDSASPAMDEFLRELGGRLRLLACWYDGSRLAASRSFVSNEVRTAACRWTCRARGEPVPGQADARDLFLTFTLEQGIAHQAGVAIAFEFAGWRADNYVMIPAAVYNGNRNRVVQRAYAAGLDRGDLYRRDLELTTGELPQLSPVPGARSKIELVSGNATTPAMGFFNRQTGRAFLVLAEQQSRGSDHGLILEESPNRSQAALVISAPGVRERKPEFIGFGSSPDRGWDWQCGDEVRLRLRLWSFATTNIPGLLEKFMAVRKEVTGPNHPRDLYPLSEVSRLMTARIDRRFHAGKVGQFYCPENAAWISFGWIGGLMNTFPMLAMGDPERLGRVRSTFDFAIPRAQGQAGYFYGALNQDGKVFGREGYDERPEIVLTRKNGDVLFWMIKQFLLLKAQGRASAIRPEWEQAMQRLGRGFAETWRRCGQWGNFVNLQTGDVAVYNSTGGAMAIGGLALAGEYFREPEFLRIAQAAAAYYYERDVVALGLTTGGCADILQNVDSESAAGFMTSLMALYEVTGEAGWREKSRNLANLLATWTVSYDYELPASTELGRLGARLAGAVWASTQNKHGAPGICTSAGDALFKLFRATGDRRYAELLRDIVHAHAEGIKPDGQITERLTYCDADSRGTRGGGSTGWNELNGALMALELPGIYVQTDREALAVFDSVQVQVVKRGPAGVELTIANPTRFDAQVAVLAEPARQAARPLGYTAFLTWPKIAVKAGTAVNLTIEPDGRLRQ